MVTAVANRQTGRCRNHAVGAFLWAPASLRSREPRLRCHANLTGVHREELLVRPVAHMPPHQVIAGLSGEDGARRVPGITHSVVEIVAHMVYW
jgi:hypothetical protein